MTLTRLAVGLEPLNALDAAHRAPRSPGKTRREIGSPAESATHRLIELNKELRNAPIAPGKVKSRDKKGVWLERIAGKLTAAKNCGIYRTFPLAKNGSK
jgi:hypothetical protein